MTKTLKFFSIILLVCLFTSFYPTTILAEPTLEEQLKQIQDDLAKINAEKSKIQQEIDANTYIIQGYNSQASALYGEVKIFQKEIDELQLKITEIELSIQLLNEKIEKNKKDIVESENSIAGLEKESTKRLKDNYMKFRVYGNEGGSGANLFNVDSINDYFKTVQYRDIIQNQTNGLLSDLSLKRQELVVKKAELDENLVQIKKEKELVESQKAALDQKKSELEVKIAQYQQQIMAIQSKLNDNQNVLAVFNQEEIQKNADAELIRQQIFNSFKPTSQGEFVRAGRAIGQQGCTGLCTGAHLHFIVWDNGNYQNPCSYLGAGPVSGCGWGNRITTWPIGGQVYYTSGYGDRCFLWNGSNYCDFHNGADFAGVPWNTAIYAAHDGYSYKGVDPYGANYVIVCQYANCASGLKTGYWHLSSF